MGTWPCLKAFPVREIGTWAVTGVEQGACGWVGCRGLACSCQGDLCRKLEHPGRRSSLAHNHLFLTATVFSLSDLDLNEPGMVPKVQFTPRGLRGYARERDRWFRGSFTSEWCARYFMHAYQWVEWQTGRMMLLDECLSKRTKSTSSYLR